MATRLSLTAEFFPQIDAVWNEVLKQQTYNNPDHIGPFGKMKRLAVVGQRHRPEPPPTELTLPLELRPEPSNKFDPKAIAVWHGDQQIGYVAKSDYDTLHELWDKFGVGDFYPSAVSGVNNDRIYLIDL